MKSKTKLWLFFFLTILLYGNHYAIFPNRAQENKTGAIEVDTVFSKVLEEESLLYLFIADQLNITSENLNLLEVTRDSLHGHLKENKQIIINKNDLEYFLNFKLEEVEPEVILSKSINLSPKVQVEKLEVDINKGELLMFKYEKEKNIISLERIEILLNNKKITNINKVKGGVPTNFEFIAGQSGKVEIIIRSLGILPQKGNVEVSIKKNKPRLKVDKFTETLIKKSLVTQFQNDTLFKTLLDENLSVNAKINPRGLSALSKTLDLSSYNKVIGLSIFYFPSNERESLEFFRKDTLREDPLEDFSIKELKGSSYTYLPEYNIENIGLYLLDSLNNTIWSNPINKINPNWKLSPNSKKNYAFLSLLDGYNLNSMQLKIINRTKLYDLEIGVKILIIYLQEFLINKEIETKELEENYVLTLL